MDNAANVNSGTESQQPATPAPAMKSTDTSINAATTASEPAKPAAKPAPAQAAADAGETGDTPGEGAGNDAASADAATKGKQDRLPRWVRERMERVRETTARETEDRIRRELGERQAPRQEAPTNVEAPNAGAKTLADFNFDTDAFMDYKVQQALEREAQQRAHQETTRKQNEAVEQFKSKIDAFETRVGAGAWEDIETSPINTDPAFKPLTDLFLGDENDLDIALYLATNITEAHRINALPRLQQVREVAKLAEQFAGEDAGDAQAQAAEVKPEPLPKKITSAPPPPKTLSNAGKSSKSVDDDSISTADRIALWQAKKNKR